MQAIKPQKTPIFVIRAGRPRVIPLSVPFQGISPTHLQQKARRGIEPGGPSSIITLETRGSPRGTPRGQEGGGQCPLPCPAREVCIAGDSAPGRGHTHQRPFVIRQCPLPLPANLSVLLTLPCPGALSLSFHLLPGRTCPQALACSLPFGKKRKDLRSSIHCRLNQCRTPPLLLPYPSFFLPLFSVKQKKSPQALFRCSYGQPPYPRPILAATSPSISSAAH